MALIVPNLEDVKDSVEPGTYSVRIVGSKVDKWAAKEEGKKDTHFVNWEMETFNETDPKNNGRRIFHRTPFTGGGAFRFAEMYKVITGQDYQGKNFDTDMFMGKEIRVVVDMQKNKDGSPSQYTEVKSVLPLQ